MDDDNEAMMTLLGNKDIARTHMGKLSFREFCLLEWILRYKFSRVYQNDFGSQLPMLE